MTKDPVYRFLGWLNLSAAMLNLGIMIASKFTDDPEAFNTSLALGTCNAVVAYLLLTGVLDRFFNRED